MGLCNEGYFRESGPLVLPKKSDAELEKLCEIEQFEHKFPFHRMRIDKYEGHIKRFVTMEDDGVISMR